ncbi:MAG: MotA/TolQ/ExbB proton channel family protein [bacterium]
MDIATLGGLAFCIAMVVIGILLGGSLTQFIDYPSMAITIGGTIGAVTMAFPLSNMINLISVTLKAVMPYSSNPTDIIKTFVTFAEKARRDGLLALESDVGNLTDSFMRKGLQLVVDGTDPAVIRTVMETDLAGMEARHATCTSIYKMMGSLAPAFGMMGTLIGLINMLAHMDDPSTIGPSMALALITTMYGFMIANMFCIPMGNKLAVYSSREAGDRILMIEGMMGIQAGDNPRVLEEKLKSFLAPAQRGAEG